ncbi:MAG TPA: AAA family ATPase, partial [Bacteroidota bacterium]|nr:AAA family ATPase [Bacteroidota bacterium]
TNSMPLRRKTKDGMPIQSDPLSAIETIAAMFPVIQLAAPTGKAAQRMGESIRKAADRIPDEKIRQHLSKLIPSTIHRLLGLYGDSPKPKRNHQSPIDADIVVIDEASMMDISQFARLIDALSPDCRLILLGDRHQLASVQAGCVMADICNAFTPNMFSAGFVKTVNNAILKPENRITNTGDGARLSPVVELQYSYRFQDCKPIGVVSKAVNSGSADDAIATLSAPQTDDEYCRLSPYPGANEMAEMVLNEYRPLFEEQSNPEQALAQLERFMVLTVLNEGPFGREGINEQVYRSYGGIPPVRPIKITENSISHQLFNGDMGVIIRATSEDGETVERAWFPSIAGNENAGTGDRDGSVQGTGSESRQLRVGALPSGTAPRQLRVGALPSGTPPRQFLVGALPAFVDAFAITIHNSQGSEFEKVAIVMPSRDTQILTRELLYTGITRAKKRAVIYGAEELVRAAVSRKIDRHSGLTERLNACD